MGDTGYYTSITIGADARPIISYFDNTNKVLRIAHCSDTLCTTSANSSLDTAGPLGWFTSITIGIDGVPVVSSYKVARVLHTAWAPHGWGR